MRILIVSHYFPPEPMRVGDLALGLKERGNEVTVLTGFPSYPSGRLYPGYRMRLVQREDYHGVSVIRVPSFPDYSPAKVNRILNYLSFALMGSVLGPLLIRKVDRILVYQNSPFTMAIPAVVIRSLRGGELFLWVQDLWPETLAELNIIRNPRLLSVVDSLVRFTYRRCARIFVQSRAFIEPVAARGVPLERIEYLPNWAEDAYTPVSADAGFLEAEGLWDGFKVMFAGNIGIAQNLHVLLDAAEGLRENAQIRFVIVGDGSDFAAVKGSAERRGLTNVIFKGRQPVEKMPQYFAAADVLFVHLMRNPVFAKTIPSKLQSYMASGRPILAALEGSGAEVVLEAQAGVVCDPDDPNALREAVLKLWQMPKGDRERMGANARAYYERYFARALVLGRLQACLEGVKPNLMEKPQVTEPTR